MLRGVTLRELAAVARLLLELVETAELHDEVEIVGDRREVHGRVVAGVHVLMLRAVRDVERRAGLPVVARAVDDAESGPREDVDGLFAVPRSARAPVSRVLRLQQRGSTRRVA